MNNVRLTKEQKAEIKQIFAVDPHNARFRILTDVLTDMQPPEGVEREFDEYSRIQMYDGFRAQSLVTHLTEEYA